MIGAASVLAADAASRDIAVIKLTSKMESAPFIALTNI